MEGSHVQIGVDVAKKYRESEAVVHAIAAHHGDVEAKTVIACLVQAADAISARPAGGPPGKPGELHQAAGEAGRGGLLLRRGGQLLRHPGRP